MSFRLVDRMGRRSVGEAVERKMQGKTTPHSVKVGLWRSFAT